MNDRLPELVLHGYWRSGTSYRTRIALNLKGLDYRQEPVDLRAGEQGKRAFRKLNPQGLVPALVAGDLVLSQSSAIIEWLEERFPDPSLLPGDMDQRAVVRAMAMVVACDIHPLNNLRVLRSIKQDLGADDRQQQQWISRWISDGFDALEQAIERHGGVFAVGDTPTLADCHIVPQAYSAERFGISLGGWPHLNKVVASAQQHEAFLAAHPDNQPDAP